MKVNSNQIYKSLESFIFIWCCSGKIPLNSPFLYTAFNRLFDPQTSTATCPSLAIRSGMEERRIKRTLPSPAYSLPVLFLRPACPTLLFPWPSQGYELSYANIINSIE